MNTKHTPGPWSVSFGGNTHEVHDAASLLLAVVPRYGAGFIPHGHSAPWHHADANAKLIAAAPELLNALELAQATIERLHRHAPGSANGTLDVVRAAIAKATE